MNTLSDSGLQEMGLAQAVPFFYANERTIDELLFSGIVDETIKKYMMNTFEEINDSFDTKFDFIEIFDEEWLYNTKRLILLMAVAIGITALVLVLWYKFRSYLYLYFGLDGTTLASELGSDLVVFMPAIVYGVAQGYVIGQINEQNMRLESAIDTLNAVLFLEVRDRRVTPLIHWMLFIASIPTIGMMCLYDYCSIEIGVFAIGTCVFLASFAFLVAMELDDPFTGYSRVAPSRIPLGWKTMTIYDIIEGRVPNFETTKKTWEHACVVVPNHVSVVPLEKEMD